MRIGVTFETRYSVITADTEEELMEKLERLKDKYDKVLNIHRQLPGNRGMWIADVSNKSK